jgi:hypothetical protein
VNAPVARLDSTATVSDTQLAVAGLRPEMTRAQVLQVVGTPSSETTDTSTAMGDQEPAHTLIYSFGSVVLYGDHLEYVTCRDASCSTPAGVRVGDSLAVAARTYGRGRDVTSNDQDAWLYPSRDSDCGLTIEYKDAVATGLLLWCDNS